MAFRTSFAGWSENRNLAGVRVQGDTARYTINWGDGTPTETVRYNEDFDSDGSFDAAFAWHDYASDGTYQVAINQPRAGLPPTRMPAFMDARDDDGLTFRTSDRNEIILTGNGADNVLANGGDDLLRGGAGGDLLGGGLSAGEFLVGGDGNDVLSATGGFVFMLGEAGDYAADASGGIVRVEGGDGGDTFTLHAISGELLDGASDDRLYSGDGSGDDRGSTRLLCGAGTDRLLDGPGAELFVFQAPTRRGIMVRDAARDVVSGFEQGQDRLDLSPWGFRREQFVGAAPFSGEAPEVRAYDKGGNTVLLGDFDGDARADVSILLVGTYVLGADDFVAAEAALSV